jgi:hypothetical protein
MDRIPPGARCTYCHSYQPLIRLEMQQDDDYTQQFRFFCNAACHANWGTNQPKPPIEKAKGKRQCKTTYWTN